MADVFPFDLRGPQFLAFYLAFAAAVICGAIVLRRALESGTPGKADLSDPRLLACLRGGPAEAIRISVLSLLDRGLLVIKGLTVSLKEGVDPALARDPLDRAVLERHRLGLTVREAPGDRILLEAAGPLVESLRARRLIPSDAETAQRRLLASAAVAALVAVGGAKVWIGIARDRPIGFLVVLVIAACVAAVMLVPRGPRTARGDALLAHARTLYGRLRLRASSFVPGSGTAEAALLAGVFGAAALTAAAWTPVRNAVKPRTKQAAASCSSCGATWSSCGSSSWSSCGSSSGSSCGSSCGGGGGCGGCGSS